MRWRPAALFCAALWSLPALPPAALAQEAAIALELNRLQTVENKCRITLVSTNAIGADLERVVVEIVLFDGERRALRFLRVVLPALAAERSRAQVFDADGVVCEEVASILFNGAVECTAPGIDDAACANAIAPSSRADIPFVLGFGEMADESIEQDQ